LFLLLLGQLLLLELFRLLLLLLLELRGGGCRGLIGRELLLALRFGFLLGLQLLLTLLLGKLGLALGFLLLGLLFLQRDVGLFVADLRRRAHGYRRGRRRSGARRRHVGHFRPQLGFGAGGRAVLPVDAVIQEESQQQVHHHGERNGAAGTALAR